MTPQSPGSGRDELAVLADISPTKETKRSPEHFQTNINTQKVSARSNGMPRACSRNERAVSERKNLVDVVVVQENRPRRGTEAERTKRCARFNR